MASKTSTANNAVKSDKKRSRVPPEEKFWKHYSPHHEFPLSSAASVLLHVVVFTVLIVGSIVLAKYFDKGPKVEIGEIVIAGGGGSPDGAEGPPTGVEAKKEAVQPATPDTEPRTETKPEELKPVNATPAPVIESAKNPDRDIEKYIGTSQKVAAAGQSLRQKVDAAIAGSASKGRGGPGQGGGKGKGVGTGEGDLSGPGKAKITQRKKRQQRWVMIFNVGNSDDYARQLQSLKAYLAVPVPEEDGKYFMIEDLTKRPVEGKKSDLNGVNRIYWIDDKPESVASLARSLGINPVPSFIVAFFPEELEKDLLDKELAYGHVAEDRIEETRFKVQRKRSGGYEPVVMDQKVN
jgi:hypothetical protein